MCEKRMLLCPWRWYTPTYCKCSHTHTHTHTHHLQLLTLSRCKVVLSGPDLWSRFIWNSQFMPRAFGYLLVLFCPGAVRSLRVNWLCSEDLCQRAVAAELMISCVCACARVCVCVWVCVCVCVWALLFLVRGRGEGEGGSADGRLCSPSLLFALSLRLVHSSWDRFLFNFDRLGTIPLCTFSYLPTCLDPARFSRSVVMSEVEQSRRITSPVCVVPCLAAPLPLPGDAAEVTDLDASTFHWTFATKGYLLV